MKPKANVNLQRTQQPRHVNGEGPNWILIAGGALLSTLSIRIGCQLKQAFDAKRSHGAHNKLKENGKRVPQRRTGACELHANGFCFAQTEDECYHCLSGNMNGTIDTKYAPTSPMSKDGVPPLPLVKIPSTEVNKDYNGVMWASSPDRLELPQKPFHRSNSSDSPPFSESGSDIYVKREVIQKLRQQLKRRDEMIMEMQTQITELHTSLTAQMSHSVNLQSQLDSANRDLFESEREIQRLRKAIADHCVAEAASPERNWQPLMNGHTNGYGDTMNEAEISRVPPEKIGMLRQEIGELKEVIEGKDFLLQSYKEAKVELSAKVKELQQKLNSQVPNIL